MRTVCCRVPQAGETGCGLVEDPPYLVNNLPLTIKEGVELAWGYELSADEAAAAIVCARHASPGMPLPRALGLPIRLGGFELTDPKDVELLASAKRRRKNLLAWQQQQEAAARAGEEAAAPAAEQWRQQQAACIAEQAQREVEAALAAVAAESPYGTSSSGGQDSPEPQRTRKRKRPAPAPSPQH